MGLFFFAAVSRARPNSLIIEGATNTTAAYDYSSKLTVHAFEITETVTEVVYDTEGNYIGKITIIPKEDNYEVNVENLHDVQVLFRNRTIKGMEKNEYGSILKIQE